MKIVFATGPKDERGGSAKYASALAAQFVPRGYSVRNVSYGAWERTFPSGLRHLLYFYRILFSLMRADVVLAFDTWSVGIPALIAAKILGKPFLVRVGGDFLWEGHVERTGALAKLSHFYEARRDNWNAKEKIIFFGTKWLLKNAAALVFNSHWQIDIWRKGYELSLPNATVVENVYPKKRESVVPTSKNFVAAGRTIKLKQEEMLNEIFTQLQTKYPDITLDTKPLPPELHQKRVSECYAVILASVSDVSPNVIIDAVVHAKPFICTDDTGIKERLGEVGIFVDTSNKEAVKEAIEGLMDAAAYERATKKVESFSFVRTWEDVADGFIHVLTSCVSSR